MIFTYSIDQVFALNNGLNLSEASVYGALRDLPGWAESMIVEGETYYFASRNKMCKEMPLVTKVSDTMYRHYKSLAKKKVIKHLKVGDKDFVHLIPSVAKTWNRAKDFQKSDELPAPGNLSAGNISDILEQPASYLSNPLTPKGEVSNELPFVGEVKEKPEKKSLRKKAIRCLKFFNEHTGRSLEGEAHIAALTKMLKRKVSAQDFAFVVYEQEHSLRGHDKRNAWLTPLTICRPANFQRALDSWKDRTPAQQQKIMWANPAHAEKQMANGQSASLSWRDWPTPDGWRKDLTSPGYYTHTAAGRMHYTEMISSRMAKAELFPAALKSVA